MGCFGTLIATACGIFVMVSLLRWFEQTVEAVDTRDWQRLLLLIAFPFAVWWYPSRVTAGRPTPVPLHEPVRGFGKVGLAEPGDRPPAGTPKEFIGMPVIPKDVKKRTQVDPEKLAKMRQKMIEQGLLKPDEDETTP